MKIMFTAWLLINGSWVHGSAVDGWWPVQSRSEYQCMTMVEYSKSYPVEGLKFTCETLEDTLEEING